MLRLSSKEWFSLFAGLVPFEMERGDRKCATGGFVLRISDIDGPIEAWRMSGIHIWDSSGNVHGRWTFESLDLVCAGRQVTA